MTFSIDLRSQLGIAGNPLVQCACGRDVNADMMRDVRPIAHLTGWQETHRCDSCVEQLHRTEKVSREAFYRAHGAPQQLLNRQVARDLGEKALRDRARTEQEQKNG